MMSSGDGQEAKYTYRFTLAARGVGVSTSEALSKLDLQSYIEDVLGITKEKKAKTDSLTV